MKTVKKISGLLVISLLAVMCLMFTAGAEELVYGDYTYTVLEDETVKITGYNASEADVVVPSEIDGKAVSAVGSRVFKNDTVESITFPEGVTEIDNMAVEGCMSLKTVNLPSTVSSVGIYMQCTALENIAVAKANKSIKSVDGVVFSADGKTLLKYPQGKALDKYVVPSTVVTIAPNAFYEVTKLGTVQIPVTVKNLDELTFAYSTVKIHYEGTSIPSAWKNALAGRTVTTNKVTLSAPSKVTSTSTTSSITLRWSKVSGATGYRIYYKTSSGWKTTVSKTTKTTHTFKNLKAAAKFTFAVKAYKTASGTDTWAKSYTTHETSTQALAPSKITATQTASSIKLSWNAVKGATGYRIYYKSGSSWKVSVSATAKTTLTYKNLKAGAKFTFAVRPYIKTADKVIWSAYKTYTAATLPAAPKTTATSTLGGQAVVSWSAVNGAESYRLYYKINNGSYKLFKTYAKPQKLTFNNLTKGAKYTFAVRAGKKTSGGEIFGAYKAVSVKIAYKITRYDKVFEKGTFLLQINDPDLGVVTMAMKGNNIYVESSMDGMSLKLIFRGDKKTLTNPDGTWYMVFDELKKYSTMPSDMMGSGADILDDFKEKNEDIAFKTTYETIGGKRYEVESGKDSKGVTYKYYFDGNTLVRSQTIAADGTKETTNFKKISSSVPDSLFEIPAGYSYMNISWILEGLDD